MPSPASVRRSYRGFLTELDHALDLARRESDCGRAAPERSHWTVQQHLEHLLLTDAAIADGLEAGLESPGPAGRGGPSLVGRMILWTGRIPRGRARAPEFVDPQGAEREEIVAGLTETRERLSALEGRLEEIRALEATIAHPILGEFTAARWLRFAHVHHRHHRRIIDDILDADVE